ncbi:hypothetical protein [Spirillospora sp. CA-294931]|uniref:hypothetical protein n=1 Tax=Spirillospora sp. CA-294931 TaxID=3240042 RepID=UPI003D94CA61
MLIRACTAAAFLTPLLATPSWADAGCGRPGQGWLCTITATATPPRGTTVGGSESSAPTGIRVEPMCAPTGGADHCITLPATPRVSTASAVEMAGDAIALPPPHPRTSPSPRTWVGVRTFLWIDRGSWRPHQAAISVDGQRIAIRGRPAKVVWDLGETTITCAGPGVPYKRGLRDSPCTHTYQRSKSDAFTITATIYYSVTWTCTGKCDTPGGSFNPLPATGSARLSVGEIQTAAH